MITEDFLKIVLRIKIRHHPSTFLNIEKFMSPSSSTKKCIFCHYLDRKFCILPWCWKNHVRSFFLRSAWRKKSDRSLKQSYCVIHKNAQLWMGRVSFFKQAKVNQDCHLMILEGVSDLTYKLYQNDWYWGMLDFLKKILKI